MAEQPRNIGIFGGTFDPVHKGHVSIAKSFLKSGKIDELWVFLNPDPPHKNGNPHEAYEARFKLLQQAFKPFDNVLVSDLETTLSKPCYTINTVKKLRKVYPQHTFFLCMGKDSFASFKNWHQWRQILDHCNLLVADRPDVDHSGDDKDLLKQTRFVDHEPIKVSSTQIREYLSEGKSIASLVPRRVESMIEHEQYYRR